MKNNTNNKIADMGDINMYGYRNNQKASYTEQKS